MADIKLSWEEISKIERNVSRGDRVEIIPVKEGVKILRVKRDANKEQRTRQYN